MKVAITVNININYGINSVWKWTTLDLSKKTYCLNYSTCITQQTNNQLLK